MAVSHAGSAEARDGAGLAAGLIGSPDRSRCLSAPAALAAAALLLLGGALAPALAQGRTIVGDWAPEGAECTPLAGTIAIGPLSIVGDDMRCDFRSVSRSGDVVTWHGGCGFPEPEERATVVAATQGDRLFLMINGGRNGPYRRCARRIR
jgi:hypothetical protein